MTLTIIPENAINSFEKAKYLRDQIAWQKMEGVALDAVLSEWLVTLSPRTQLNYRSGVNRLIEFGIIDPFMSLQAFSLVNFDGVVDKIKQLPMKENTRQARAALYISFTRYLSRRFKGMFTKAIPSREGNEKTFFRVHEKVATEAMNQSQWITFFAELEKINSRDALLGKLLLQGGKRVREVISLQVEQIHWESREITFNQSKTRGINKKTTITYSEQIMKQLQDLIGDRSGHVFISRKGNALTLNQLANTFEKAGQRAGIQFTVTPHVLRASCVTSLKKQGFSDGEVMKITGHASSEMLRAYDKSDRADNPSKKVNLI